MGGKVSLRYKGKTFEKANFVFQKFIDNAKQCFAFTAQAYFSARNLSVH